MGRSRARQGLAPRYLCVADGLTNGSLIWVMDGSYNRKKAIDLCSVGWIIFCTKTGYRITGNFWEKSNSASLYRAELLGLYAMHILARAAAEYHHINRWSATLCCDNLRALEMPSHHHSRIQPSAKCADIRHSLRMTKQLLHGAFQYVHVYGHMNRFLQ